MLTRIISSIVAIAIAVFILYFYNTVIFECAIAIASVVIVYELLKAAKLCGGKISFFTALAHAFSVPLIPYFGLGKFRVFLGLLAIFLVMLDYVMHHEKYKFETVFFIISIMFLIPYSLNCLILLREMDKEHGLVYAVLALCGAWLADTGAYFTGTFLGKHKLCPKISPKKTVEGFIGGVLFTGAVFALFAKIYIYNVNNSLLEQIDGEYGVYYIGVFILGMACAVMGTIGDLVASLIKRQCNIKDYGKIMPGHGGLLDRFDSVLFVVPFFYAFLTIFKIFS